MALRRRPTAAPPLLCRWDLDKTYLRSQFETLRQLIRTARESGADKIEVPGVAALMKAMRRSADAQGRDLKAYFISASPPQIGQAVRDKLALDGVPYDGITFKDQLQLIKQGKLKNLREHVGYKIGELLRGRLEAAPGAVEFLFGDDWESDPLSYSLYADVLAGAVDPSRLARLLVRIGVDAPAIPGICGLAERAVGCGRVERIFINLERRTPPRAFRAYGARLVPAFDYFQTAVVLAAAGHVAAEDLAEVARAMIDRGGFTPRRLANTLADVVRRGILASEVAEPLVEPLRQAHLLPVVTTARTGWLRRLVWRMRRGKRAVASPVVEQIDYEFLLDRRSEAAQARAAGEGG